MFIALARYNYEINDILWLLKKRSFLCFGDMQQAARNFSDHSVIHVRVDENFQCKNHAS